MIKLFISDICRLQNYFGKSGLLFWTKVILTRSFWSVFFIRMRGVKVPILGFFLGSVAAVILTIFFKIELAGKCNIGPGLILPHPHDLILGAYEIGSNATLMNSITLGAQHADPAFTPHMRPKLGNNVVIGVGARVLGGIMIGNGSTVGANSVVVKSVPDEVVVAGIPAQVLKSKKDQSLDN